MSIDYYGISDIGPVRQENQDCCNAYKLYDNAYLFIVCDGMGGNNGGKTASVTASKEFSAKIKEGLARFAEGDKIPRKALRSIPRCMADALLKTNSAVFALASENKLLSGMGTTLVAMLAIDDKAFIINVGDSRAYVAEENAILQITKDHSYVQFLVDAGKITPEEARNHPNKNVITRSVGVEPNVAPDIFRMTLNKNQHILLCSDGLSNFVSEEAILRCLCVDTQIESKVRILVEQAKLGGGNDNITALVIEYDK